MGSSWSEKDGNYLDSCSKEKKVKACITIFLDSFFCIEDVPWCGDVSSLIEYIFGKWELEKGLGYVALMGNFFRVLQVGLTMQLNYIISKAYQILRCKYERWWIGV